MLVFSSIYHGLISHWFGPWCVMVLYVFAALMQWRVLRVRTLPMWCFWVVSVLAIVLHGMLLYRWIDIGGLQNLSPGNLFSLLCWTMAVSLMLMAWRPYMLCLSIVLYPLAVASILWVLFYPVQTWVVTLGNGTRLLHILLAILVVNMLALAALMAMLMAWQERRIRDHHLGMLDHSLPSLVLMEQHVFQMICLGFLLLSVMLLMSVHQYGWLLWSSGGLRFKLILVLLAWLVFAGSLLARWVFGYRGHRVVYMTLLGVGLLFVVYMGIERVSL